MDIVFRTQKLDEGTAVELLNVLARHNVAQMRQTKLPLLYDSGVVYRRETVELWSDAASLLEAGHEDCDALAAYRAAELVVKGHLALHPGEHGFAEARRRKLPTIAAEVLMTTRDAVFEATGKRLYHCIVRYRVGRDWHRDDPSRRLGMLNGQVDKRVLTRWRAAGVRARAPMEIR